MTLASQAKLEERELWHKLVVKVLVWKDGSNRSSIHDKITQEEWRTYHKKMVEINVTYDKNRVLTELKETQFQIAKNGGFQD